MWSGCVFRSFSFYNDLYVGKKALQRTKDWLKDLVDVLSLPCVEWERDWCRQSFSCVLQTWVQVSSIHILLDGNVGISAIRFFGFPRYFGSCILAEAQSAPQQCTGWEHPFLNTASFCSAFLMWDSLSDIRNYKPKADHQDLNLAFYMKFKSLASKAVLVLVS